MSSVRPGRDRSVSAAGLELDVVDVTRRRTGPSRVAPRRLRSCPRSGRARRRRSSSVHCDQTSSVRVRTRKLESGGALPRPRGARDDEPVGGLGPAQRQRRPCRRRPLGRSPLALGCRLATARVRPTATVGSTGTRSGAAEPIAGAVSAAAEATPALAESGRTDEGVAWPMGATRAVPVTTAAAVSRRKEVRAHRLLWKGSVITCFTHVTAVTGRVATVSLELQMCNSMRYERFTSTNSSNNRIICSMRRRRFLRLCAAIETTGVLLAGTGAVEATTADEELDAEMDAAAAAQALADPVADAPGSSSFALTTGTPPANWRADPSAATSKATDWAGCEAQVLNPHWSRAELRQPRCSRHAIDARVHTRRSRSEAPGRWRCSPTTRGRKASIVATSKQRQNIDTNWRWKSRSTRRRKRSGDLVKAWEYFRGGPLGESSPPAPAQSRIRALTHRVRRSQVA